MSILSDVFEFAEKRCATKNNTSSTIYTNLDSPFPTKTRLVSNQGSNPSAWYTKSAKVDEISPSKTTSLLEKKAKRNVSCITTQKTTTAIHNKRKRSQSRLFPISPVEEIGLRILIVDDNPINLNILKKSLHILFKKIKRLEEATNGVEALNLVNLHLFDIILMDIDMPLLNGVETAKHIRKSNTTIPIIAVTTKDSIESRNLYKEIGMNDCLSKPVNIDLLEQSIFKTLSISPSPSSTSYSTTVINTTSTLANTTTSSSGSCPAPPSPPIEQEDSTIKDYH